MPWSDRVSWLVLLTGVLTAVDVTFTRSLHAQEAVAASATQPLVFGETFAMTSRYAVTAESGIIGESLAGLFVVETLVLEPSLFDHYLAFDPSLWWNAEGLTPVAATRLRGLRGPRKQLAMVLSSEPTIVAPGERFRAALAAADTTLLSWRMSTMPAETHATIYHPAALATLRLVFAPPGEKGKGRN
jgi:predicted alpha/beta superfamily hydrolase